MLKPLSDAERLDLSREEMRRIGHRVVDMIADHLAGLHEHPASAHASRQVMEQLLRQDPPPDGESIEHILGQLRDDVLSKMVPANHPRNFAWVPGPSNFIGALGDFISSAYNVATSTWIESPGPTEVELIALDWIRDWMGLPGTAGGIFTSGGSMANLVGLGVARCVTLQNDVQGAVAYCSSQLHSSVTRNLRVLGFLPQQIRRVPAGEDLKMSVADLARLVAEDRRAGLKPFSVLATAGTTNTGTVDPLPAIADFCEAEGLWFHVDGAYGAAARLCARGQAALAGLERAHSLAVDPHKWLHQPIEMGCAMVRESHWLEQTYGENPEYLADTKDDTDATQEVNFGDRGPQLTRSGRALKLWMSVKYFGEKALIASVDRGFDVAERAAELLMEAGCFEITTPPQMAVITFRYVAPRFTPEQLDALNRGIYARNARHGYAFFTTTIIRGMRVLRFCTINPRTTDEELRRVVADLARFGHDLAAEMGGSPQPAPTATA